MNKEEIIQIQELKSKEGVHRFIDENNIHIGINVVLSPQSLLFQGL